MVFTNVHCLQVLILSTDNMKTYLISVINVILITNVTFQNKVKDIVNLEALFMSLCNVIVINILKCIKP